MSAQWETFRAQKTFGSLDGLRAISILGVVYHHCMHGFAQFHGMQGALGVPLFFSISGFLITTLLLRERDAHGDISLRNFYVRRSLRIFPLYYAVIAVYVAVVWLAERDTDDGREYFRNLPYFLSYTSNWFVASQGRVIFLFAWSLATEEQFYLLWPSVEKLHRSFPQLDALLRGHTPAALALALVALTSWAATSPAVLSAHPLALAMLQSIAPAILLGVVLAHALHDKRGFTWLSNALGQRAASAVLLAAVIAALVIDPLRLLTFALMTLLVATCVMREDHVLARVLAWRSLVSIGQVSYGVYLLHMLVLNVVVKLAARAHVQSRVAIFIAVVLGAWGAAWISFHTFEAFFLKFKTRFSRAT